MLPEFSQVLKLDDNEQDPKYSADSVHLFLASSECRNPSANDQVILKRLIAQSSQDISRITILECADTANDHTDGDIH